MCALLALMEDKSRKLVFAPKTQIQRRQRDTAIAWVTAQQPGRVFEGANVTAYIHTALKRIGYNTDQKAIKHGIDALVREGWAESLVIGRRTRMFMLRADVEVPEPVFITAAKQAATTATKSQRGKLTLKTHQMPPLPRQPKLPAWWERFNEILITWYHEEPDEVTEWAQQVAMTLGHEL